MIVFPVEDINPTRRRPYVTYGLIAVQAILFLAFGFLSDWPTMVTNYGFVPGTPTWGGALRGLFMHSDIAHLLVNLVFLAILADNVEDSLGHVGFAAFYLGTGLFAEYAHRLTVPVEFVYTPVLGSSGAVSAVVGAYALLFPHSRILFKGFVWVGYYFRILKFTVPSLWAVVFWFILQALALYADYGSGHMDMVSLGAGFVAGVVVVGLLAMLGPVELQWRQPDFLPGDMGTVESSVDCPGCLSPMDLTRVEGVMVDLCPSCGGLWLDKGELDSLVRVERLPQEVLDPPAASKEHVVLQEGERVCPRCQGMFGLREFRGTVIEHCKNCGGMWLEKGELAQLLGKR